MPGAFYCGYMNPPAEREILVEGAWDTHVHAGPDVIPRKADVVDLLRSAETMEMGGLVLKNHHFPTAMLARLGERLGNSDVALVGTVVLNRSVGGLNPDAVVAADAMGASRVELPTTTAKHNMMDQGEPRTIELLSDSGLSRECRSVLDEAIDRGLIVGTGHVSETEVEAVVDYVCDRGGRVLITHPELHAARDGVGLTDSQQANLARDGVYFERCYVVTNDEMADHLLPDAPEAARQAFIGDSMWDRIVSGIEATGPEHNVISSDLGQSTNDMPTDGLSKFHARLSEAGFGRSELEQMVRDNPSELFG